MNFSLNDFHFLLCLYSFIFHLFTYYIHCSLYIPLTFISFIVVVLNSLSTYFKLYSNSESVFVCFFLFFLSFILFYFFVSFFSLSFSFFFVKGRRLSWLRVMFSYIFTFPVINYMLDIANPMLLTVWNYFFFL